MDNKQQYEAEIAKIIADNHALESQIVRNKERIKELEISQHKVKCAVGQYILDVYYNRIGKITEITTSMDVPNYRISCLDNNGKWNTECLVAEHNACHMPNMTDAVFEAYKKLLTAHYNKIKEHEAAISFNRKRIGNIFTDFKSGRDPQ